MPTPSLPDLNTSPPLVSDSFAVPHGRAASVAGGARAAVSSGPKMSFAEFAAASRALKEEMARRQEELLDRMRSTTLGPALKVEAPIEEVVEEEEPDPLLSENARLRHELEEARRMVGSWRLDVVPEVAALDPEPVREFRPSRSTLDTVLASVSSRVKAPQPTAWDGSWDYKKRELWIESVRLYCSSVGLQLDARLDKEATPLPYSLVRSFFATTGQGGRIAPIIWFDNRNREQPFVSVNDVLEAVRAHWSDPLAAERALIAFHQAKQGEMMARDFAAHVSDLAADVTDRFISDLDRRTVFLHGLNANVADHVRASMGMFRVLRGRDASFTECVEIAKETDGMDAFKRKGPATKEVRRGDSGSVPAAKATATKATSTPPSASPGSAAENRDSWVKAAKRWQADCKWEDRAAWHKATFTKLPKPVRCWNCGCIDTHPSRGCPNSRRSPDSVFTAPVVAALAPATPSSASSGVSIGDQQPTAMTVASSEGSVAGNA